MTGKRVPKKKRTRLTTGTAEQNRQRGFEIAQSSNAAIRSEMQSPRTDQAGTAPGAVARVKMESEEGRHAVCGECGSAGGRHLSVCSRVES